MIGLRSSRGALAMIAATGAPLEESSFGFVSHWAGIRFRHTTIRTLVERDLLRLEGRYPSRAAILTASGAELTRQWFAARRARHDILGNSPMTLPHPMLSPEQRAMAFEAIETVIAEVDSSADDVLCTRTVGTSRDPATMEPEDRAMYERLITIARRARCALTLLKAGT